MTVLSPLRRPTLKTSLMLSAGLLTSSALLLWLHATSVRDMREVGLPAALALPAIEKRIEILQEQNEIAELQSAMRGGSSEEYLRVYVVPEEEDIDRLLATFDVLFNYLQRQRLLSSFSSIAVGEREHVEEGIDALPISFEADMTQEGLETMSLFFELSGLLTISDALSPAEIDHLLALTEEENPAAVSALEHLLSVDLLRYAEEPKSYEEVLRKSFSSPVFETSLQSILNGRLRSVRELFGDLAPVLRRQNLWPLRLLSVESASSSHSGQSVHASFMLRAYVRSK